MANVLLTAKEGSNAYRNFINTVDSEATKESYEYVLSKFMQYNNVDSYDKLLLFEPKILEGLISGYITHLRVDKRLSYNSINLYYAAISHFYQMNDTILNWKKLTKFKGKKRLVVEDEPYSKEQIRQLLDFADLRLKCIILLMCSAGLRRGAIPKLRIKDLKKIEKYGLYRILIYKNESESYNTFCTPECTKILEQYFEWRAMQGETLTDTTPVIRKEFNSLNVARPEAITVYTIDWLIGKLLDKSCIRPKIDNKLKKRTFIMQNHGFRKYFETTAKLAGMDSLLIDRCMGHKTGLHDSYSKLNEEQTLEGNGNMIGYVGAIDDLTINEEHRLQRKVQEMQVQHTEEWESLRREMAEVKKNLRIT
jgi:integrase